MYFVKENIMEREYNSGRRDQADTDYLVFRELVEEAVTKEELAEMIDERFNLIAEKMARKRSKNLMEELELI